MTGRRRFWSIVAATALAVLAGLILVGVYQDEVDADDRPWDGD